jgi:hypothetical protein
MMEDKLDRLSNFKFLEDKTSNEDLLSVIQKGVIVTYLLHEDVRGQRSSMCLWRNHINTLRYSLIYIYYLYHCHEGNCHTKEPLLKSWIQRDLSAFRETTH